MLFDALRTVCEAAGRELNHGAGCREINRPLSVTNRGLARRFGTMSDATLLHHLRRAEADVPFLVYHALRAVLSSKDLLDAVAQGMRGLPPLLGPTTAAALHVIEYVDRETYAAQWADMRANRIAQFLDDGGA
ncbi:MAG TPA: hypothetical protein VF595_10540 [Tepidisphaeraceae bacterium]|jgi:hypothetical protein